MLLDRATALTAKINSFQKLKNAAEQADQFATRANQFFDASLRVKHLSDSLSALAEAGVRVDFEPSSGLSYAEKAGLLRTTLKSDPKKLNDPPFDIKYDFLDRLAGIANSGDRTARAAWQAYVDERAAFSADEVLIALAQVPHFKTSVDAIQKLRGAVADLGACLPEDPKDAIAKLDALLRQHKAAWTSLDAADIPPSVVAFIREAASGEAMLSTYTSEVQGWLASRNLVGAFRIKLR